MAKPVRIAFLGNDRWSVPSLEALGASGHELVAVVTAAPKPAGRGSALTPTPVAAAARDLGAPLREVETVASGSGFDAIASRAPDVLVVVAYGEILPEELLLVPSIAPVNLHFSLLPKLRGASPVQSALMLGLEETGVTTIVMDAGLDTGPVLQQRPVRIEPEDDAGSLGARLATAGAELLVRTIDALVDGTDEPKPQDERLATFTKRLRTGDRVLDWSRPAGDLVNQCRAMSPEPGATTTFRGETLKVFRARATHATGEHGAIVEVSKDGFVVATGEGGLAPLELAPAGRRRMSASDFVHGRHPEVGERLG